MGAETQKNERHIVEQPLIAIVGPTGDLGGRILRALVARGASVRALIRTSADGANAEAVRATGAQVTRVDEKDVSALSQALTGAHCVVSALNGLHEVIVERQGLLLDAAIRAGVPRLISSDYSADFTKTKPGENRNFDLRREFMALADRAPVKATSILNGAFMDMLGAEMPIIQPAIRRVLHWGSADQLLDFTTKDNVAAFVAAVALDPATPRILRIAGDSVSARDLALAMSEISGKRYRTFRIGSVGSLGALIHIVKALSPNTNAAFPPWQGMQYMRDMFSGLGKLHPLDNQRYVDIRWISVRAYLISRKQSPEDSGR